jgi:hypothetical protein
MKRLLAELRMLQRYWCVRLAALGGLRWPGWSAIPRFSRA